MIHKKLRKKINRKTRRKKGGSGDNKIVIDKPLDEYKKELETLIDKKLGNNKDKYKPTVVNALENAKKVFMNKIGVGYTEQDDSYYISEAISANIKELYDKFIKNFNFNPGIITAKNNLGKKQDNKKVQLYWYAFLLHNKELINKYIQNIGPFGSTKLNNLTISVEETTDNFGIKLVLKNKSEGSEEKKTEGTEEDEITEEVNEAEEAKQAEESKHDEPAETDEKTKSNPYYVLYKNVKIKEIDPTTYQILEVEKGSEYLKTKYLVELVIFQKNKSTIGYTSAINTKKIPKELVSGVTASINNPEVLPKKYKMKPRMFMKGKSGLLAELKALSNKNDIILGFANEQTDEILQRGKENRDKESNDTRLEAFIMQVLSELTQDERDKYKQESSNKSLKEKFNIARIIKLEGELKRKEKEFEKLKTSKANTYKLIQGKLETITINNIYGSNNYNENYKKISDKINLIDEALDTIETNIIPGYEEIEITYDHRNPNNKFVGKFDSYSSNHKYTFYDGRTREEKERDSKNEKELFTISFPKSSLLFQAGLRSGDVIYKVNDRPASSFTTDKDNTRFQYLNRYVMSKINEPIKFVVLREINKPIKFNFQTYNLPDNPFKDLDIKVCKFKGNMIVVNTVELFKSKGGFYGYYSNTLPSGSSINRVNDIDIVKELEKSDDVNDVFEKIKNLEGGITLKFSSIKVDNKTIYLKEITNPITSDFKISYIQLKNLEKNAKLGIKTSYISNKSLYIEKINDILHKMGMNSGGLIMGIFESNNKDILEDEFKQLQEKIYNIDSINRDELLATYTESLVKIKRWITEGKKILVYTPSFYSLGISNALQVGLKTRKRLYHAIKFSQFTKNKDGKITAETPINEPMKAGKRIIRRTRKMK
jgi:hypothetical protein